MENETNNTNGPNDKPVPQSTQSTGKLVAILSYFWPIGLIIHYASSNRTELGAFHVRQATGLVILSVAVSILAGILSLIGIRFLSIVFRVINIGIFVLWIIGIVNAVKEEKKPLPIVGEMFDKMLEAIK